MIPRAANRTTRTPKVVVSTYSRKRTFAHEHTRFTEQLNTPFPPLPSVLDALDEALAGANRYPEFAPLRLSELIAGHIGGRADQVVVGAGATGVAMQIMQTLPRRGAPFVFAAPTFDGYPILAGMTGLRPVPVPVDLHGRQDLWAMARLVDADTGLVAVCRPHNPTGTVLSRSELGAFLCAVPAGVPVLLDEAYLEFLGASEVLDTAVLRALTGDREPRARALAPDDSHLIALTVPCGPSAAPGPRRR